MMDLISFIMEFIRVDIFYGYALFSIAFIIASFFIKNKDFIDKSNDASNKVVIYSGIVYFICLVLFIVEIYFSDESKSYMFSKYWYFPWLQPLFWIVITQLLWIRKIANSRILRIVFSLFLLISFEMMVILLSSFHRDYLPSSWSFTETNRPVVLYLELLFHAFLKISIFCLLSYVYYMISQKIKRSSL